LANPTKRIRMSDSTPAGIPESPPDAPVPAAITATEAAVAPPAGWYPRPDTGQREYWDGSAWTGQVQPASARLALLGFIGGIVAFLLGLVPVLGLLLAIGAGVVSVLGLTRKLTPKWMPVVGLVLSILAFFAGVGSIAALGGAGSQVSSSDRPAVVSPSATSDPEPVDIEVEVPMLVGLTVADARSAAVAVGLEFDSAGSDDWLVTAQTPEAGSLVEEGTAITATAAPNLSAFDKLDKRTFAQLAKNPDAFIGTNLITYGVVTQFDSATGKCAMRLNTAHTSAEFSFDYDNNTLAISGDAESVCPVLDPVVQDDHVKLWATVLGAYEYETAIGGTATAILLDVHKVQQLDQQEY
jgi:hypothetical protein